MSGSMLTSIVIFSLVYALIVSEKIHRTIIALCGAMLMIYSGVLSQEKAVQHIDFNTIGLLFGMMVIVNITAETGFFRYLAVKVARLANGEPKRLLVLLSILTAFCSAFLDNVTTVLLIVPITIGITKQLKVAPQPYLISQIMASNIGGTATLIGDPPNIMIGSAVKELSFISFINNLTAINCLILLVTVGILLIIYRKKLKTTPECKKLLLGLEARSMIKQPEQLKKCYAVLALTIALFFLHQQLQLESASVALCGAALLLLISPSLYGNAALERVFRAVEWPALLFFVGLFILVGGLVETGVIALLAEKALAFTSGDLEGTVILVLWVSAIASAFIDNIPFVAAMIPLIQDLGALGMSNLEPVWWSLSLGACLGGNGTLIGASANIIVAGLAAQEGHTISFRQYLKIAFPLMLLSIAISHLYLVWRYL